VSRDETVRWFNLILSLANEICDETTYNAWVDIVEKRARADGALIALQVVLLGRAGLDTRAGRFTAAELAYDEAIEVTRIIGGSAQFYELLKADLFAWRGQEPEARAAARTLRELASAVGTAAAVTMADIAVGTLELGLGQYERALRAVEPAVEHNMPGWTCLALPIAVEGAARSGQTDVAALHLEALAARATPSGTDWALGQLARCRALIGNGDVEPDHREAITRLSRTSQVVQVAQARLGYGEWLRREHRRVDARVELRAAHEMFSSMGAEAFASRAQSELLATGERVHSRRADTRQELTVQEGRAARLAAGGATNSEIAAQMFISANTVDYHLRKVYRKLNVSSRRELARLLPSLNS
jgi:DNA-binding CsgD family transcriptional regulator/tetratricopeptide (TPR) repeat protein